MSTKRSSTSTKRPSTSTKRTPTSGRRTSATDDRSLIVRDLHAAPVADPSHEILDGIDLTIGQGEVHAVMGPNGSGKTTLAYALLGHPAYVITKGSITWKGRDITRLSPDKRARLGLFLAFQYPTSVPGLSVASFLRTALNARRRPLDISADGHDPSDMTRGGIPMGEFRTLVRAKMEQLAIDPAMGARYLNEGFSGGEKKRLEMLQMSVLEPEMAILDETDSGLDIDALRIVAEGINQMLRPDLGVLLITHYQRILDYITPHRVHVLGRGRIIKSGGAELARVLEAEGYAPILAAAGLEADARDEAARDAAARDTALTAGAA